MSETQEPAPIVHEFDADGRIIDKRAAQAHQPAMPMPARTETMSSEAEAMMRAKAAAAAQAAAQPAPTPSVPPVANPAT